MTPHTVIAGDSPVILTMPHGGTYVPDDMLARFNDVGRSMQDTDWHIPRLYNGLLPEATRVIANFNRYVIDANRDPADESLYPGQNTTSLCPVRSFGDQPIYQSGQEPDAAEIAERLTQFHRPYHAAIEEEVNRVKALHGLAVIFDCHSIRGNVSFLFEGQLPDLNIGTFNSQSCCKEIEEIFTKTINTSNNYSHVLNGRFKGGWTTRHYGTPENNVHAIQLEIVQSTYMAESPPWGYVPEKASQLRDLLGVVMDNTDNVARKMSLKLNEVSHGV